METSGGGQLWEGTSYQRARQRGHAAGAVLSGGPSRGAAVRPHLCSRRAAGLRKQRAHQGLPGAVVLGGGMCSEQGNEKCRDGAVLTQSRLYTGTHRGDTMVHNHTHMHAHMCAHRSQQPGDVEEDSEGINVDLVVRLY